MTTVFSEDSRSPRNFGEPMGASSSRFRRRFGWTAALLFFGGVTGCSREPEALNRPVVAAQPPDVPTSTLDPALVRIIHSARQQLATNLQSAAAWGRLGQTLEAANFLPEAQTCYQNASDREPDSARWRHLLALRELSERPDAAVQNLQRAVQLTGATNDASRLRLAQALIERGRSGEADILLRSLLQARPDHPAARLELGRISLTTPGPDDLLALLAPCLTNPYTARPAHLLLSQVCLRLGQADVAERHAQLGASLPKPFDWPDPFLREVQAFRQDGRRRAEQANQLLAQRRWVEAEALITKLLAEAPDDQEGLLLLGRLRLQQRRCDEAERWFQKGLTTRPDSPNAWVQLGMARYCLTRWADAAKAFEQAIQLKPDFAQAHFNLGLARSRLGDPARAAASLGEALRCNPGDANAHAALAGELSQMGERTQALQHAEQALSLEPNHPQAKALREKLSPVPSRSPPN